MTTRLYYHDSFLYSFEAQVIESVEHQGRTAIVLDRTAFYPTSGGQVYDTGKFILGDEREVEIVEVAEEEDGKIYHLTSTAVEPGRAVRGLVDAARRRDHMQQHSGQHVLSAAFVRLFDAPTVSFHMGVESCTIDLAVKSLSSQQVVQAEQLANQVVMEDRPVSIRFVSLEEARRLDLRKLPPKQTGQLRLINIADFDLCACGGTHVRSTGQIGAILLRKIENVKQGVRVEFVCGLRAVATARQDYATLTEAAGYFSAHIREVPQQVQKVIQEGKAAAKVQHKLLEELAELQAKSLLAQKTNRVAQPPGPATERVAQPPSAVSSLDHPQHRHEPERISELVVKAISSPRVVVATFPDRDVTFIKLLAQKLTAQPEVIALLASSAGQPAIVFAQTPGMKSNMGQLLKEVMAKLGGRGGGSADMAQGGLTTGADLKQIENILRETAARLGV